MNEFLSLVPRSFGLDFSDRSLKFCMLHSSRPRVASFGEVALPAGIIEQGEVKNVQELARAMREGMKAVRGSSLPRHCVASLPDEKAFVQVVQLPKMSVAKEEIRGAIAFQAENYIPYPIDTVYFDFEVLPSLGTRLDHSDVLIAAIPRAVVDPYVLAAKEAGVTFSLMELESFSLCRALVKGSFSPVPLLVLDMGMTRTGFIVFFGSSVRFTASIGVSASSCTKKVEEALSVTAEEAELLKQEYGVSSNVKRGREVADALTPVFSNLVSQITQYLSYYNSHTPHVHAKHSRLDIQAMILCGGGAMTKGIETFLSSRLHLSVRLGNPWVNVQWPFVDELPGMPYGESLRYAGALGLAMKSRQLKPLL